MKTLERIEARLIVEASDKANPAPVATLKRMAVVLSKLGEVITSPTDATSIGLVSTTLKKSELIPSCTEVGFVFAESGSSNLIPFVFADVTGYLVYRRMKPGNPAKYISGCTFSFMSLYDAQAEKERSDKFHSDYAQEKLDKLAIFKTNIKVFKQLGAPFTLFGHLRFKYADRDTPEVRKLLQRKLKALGATYNKGWKLKGLNLDIDYRRCSIWMISLTSDKLGKYPGMGVLPISKTGRLDEKVGDTYL
jgi:hypothetical protein